MTAVTKLIDGYLVEVAPDVNLKLPKFQALAASVPGYARLLDDGLCRAIDIYLKIAIRSQGVDPCRLPPLTCALDNGDHSSSSVSFGLVISQRFLCLRQRLRTLTTDHYNSSGSSMGSTSRANTAHMADVKGKDPHHRHDTRTGDRRAFDSKLEGATDQSNQHSNRVMRRRYERHDSSKLNSYRRGKGPYDRTTASTWRVKRRDQEGNASPMERGAARGDPVDRRGATPSSHDAARVDMEKQSSNTQLSSEVITSGNLGQNKRLASTIVSPELRLTMEGNVTLRNKNVKKPLTFSAREHPPEADEQVIGALSDMEVQHEDGVDEQLLAGDDLFDEELKDLEDKSHSPEALPPRRRDHDSNGKKAARNHTSKPEYLRRGSPRLRVHMSSSQRVGASEKPRRSHNR
ncbi:unnamed protein product, partial [Eruca vesicaria subsp. sativa]|nr:unnamed protein product [Eruca vesicaria subsp. sativa]